MMAAVSRAKRSRWLITSPDDDQRASGAGSRTQGARACQQAVAYRFKLLRRLGLLARHGSRVSFRTITALNVNECRLSAGLAHTDARVRRQGRNPAARREHQQSHRGPGYGCRLVDMPIDRRGSRRQLWAEASPSGGTIFRFTLPALR